MEQSDLSEQQIIDSFNSGNMETFRLIYRKYRPMLRSFALKFTNQDTAEDLIQDVFMRVWVTRETSPINESIQSFLFRAVRNRCINHLEHLKIKTSYENRQLIDQQIREAHFFQSPEQLLIQQEQLDMVKKEIEKLPEKSREVFKMAYYDDKKAADIAAELNLSVRTVETQIYKALKTLRNVFYSANNK